MNIKKSKTFNYLFHSNDDRPGIHLGENNNLWFKFKSSGSAEPLYGEKGGFGTDPLPFNEWIHVAMTWDGKIFKGYINGKAAGSKELPYFTPGSVMKIGCDGSALRSFEGLIDDVRIYTKALDDSAILLMADADKDGMADGWEKSHFNDFSHDGSADTDNDGVTDLKEYQNSTDPMKNTDTDNDGMPDDWETAHGLNPNLNTDALSDMDSDGVSNLSEYLNKTDPGTKDYFKISGTVSFTGEQTGLLYIAAFDTTDTSFSRPAGEQTHDWSAGMGSAAYTLAVPNGTYSLRAFIDSNDNSEADTGEAQGKYSTAVITISGADDTANRDFAMSIAETPVFTGIKIYAGDADAEDWFGFYRQSVAIDGDYAVVGAPEYRDAEEKGAAYVYKREGEKWNQVAKLTASDGTAKDNFGHSVDISGNTIIVGRFITDQPADPAQIRTGAAYIFVKPSDGWKDMTETAKLTFSDGSSPNPETNAFGRSVAISGDYAAVSAYYDCNNKYIAGAVYVFEKPTDGWRDMTETAMLKSDDPQRWGYVGSSVDIEGNYIIAGAPGYNNSGEASGAAYVFKRENGIWIQKQKLLAGDGSEKDHFGASVAISGDTVIIGADHAPHNDGDKIGSAYIFQQNTSGLWTQKAKLLSGDLVEGDLLGFTVSIFGKLAAVSAWGDDDKGDASGSVYLYEMPSDGWKDMTEKAKIVPDDGQTGDRFGYSVSVSGNYLIASAPLDDDKSLNAGAAYIYRVSKTGTDTPDINRGLAAYYPFDTDFQDKSGQERHALAVGTPELIADQCNIGKALHVNEGSYLRVPAEKRFVPGAENFSVSLWYRMDSLEDIPNSRLFTLQAGDFRDGIAIWVSTRDKGYPYIRLMMDDREGDTTFQNLYTGEIELGKWTQITAVIDHENKKVSLWMNGQKVDEQVLMMGSIDPTKDMLIGAYNLGDRIASDNILIDDLRIYSRAINDAEILELSKPCEQSATENTVTIVPSATIVKTGETVETEIRVKGENIWAVHADITADPKILAPKDGGKYGDVFAPAQRFEIPPAYKAASGTWTGAMSLTTPAEPFTGEDVFAKLKYTILPGSYGETRISGQVILSDRNGTLVPVQVTDAVITIDDGIHGGDGVIQGTITLPDGTPVAGADVTISVGGKEYTVKTDENGHYIFEDLRDLNPGESFTVTASKDGFTASATVDSVENPVTLDMKVLNTMLADLNKDGIVDIADFTLLANSYGLSEGAAGYESRADLNGDKTVNIQDLALLGSHWKIK